MLEKMTLMLFETSSMIGMLRCDKSFASGRNKPKIAIRSEMNGTDDVITKNEACAA